MKNEFRERIGKDLRVLRILWGIPQIEMCEVIGIEQSAISRVENGKQGLTDEQFLKARAWVRAQPNLFLDEV